MRGDSHHAAKLGVAGKDGAHAIGHHKTQRGLVQGMVEPMDDRRFGVAGLLHAQGLQTQQVLRTTLLHKYGHMQIAISFGVEVAHPRRLHATSCLRLAQQNLQSLAFIGVKQLRHIAARQFATQVFEQQLRGAVGLHDAALRHINHQHRVSHRLKQQAVPCLHVTQAQKVPLHRLMRLDQAALHLRQAT